MNTTIRVLIRDNELSYSMRDVYKNFDSFLQAVRFCSKAYKSLGKTSLRRGIFYSNNYKQIMVSKQYAARDTVAMIVIER